MADFASFDEWHAKFTKKGLTQFFKRKDKLVLDLASSSLLADYLSSDASLDDKIKKFTALKPHLELFAQNIDAKTFAKGLAPNASLFADILGSDVESFARGLGPNSGAFAHGLEAYILDFTMSLGEDIEGFMRGVDKHAKCLASRIYDSTHLFTKGITPHAEKFAKGAGRNIEYFMRGLKHRSEVFAFELGEESESLAKGLGKNNKFLTAGLAQHNYDFARGLSANASHFFEGLEPNEVYFATGLDKYARLFSEGLGPEHWQILANKLKTLNNQLGAVPFNINPTPGHINFRSTGRFYVRCFFCREKIQDEPDRTTCDCEEVYHSKCAKRIKKCYSRDCNYKF